eukprot:g7244.t1
MPTTSMPTTSINNHWESHVSQALSSKSDLADFGYRNAMRRALTDGSNTTFADDLGTGFKQFQKYKTVVGGAELNSGYGYLRFMRDLFMSLSPVGQRLESEGSYCSCYKWSGASDAVEQKDEQVFGENTNAATSLAPSVTKAESSESVHDTDRWDPNMHGTAVDHALISANALHPVSVEQEILYPPIEGLHRNLDPGNFHKLKQADFSRDSWMDGGRKHVFASFQDDLDFSLLFANGTEHARVKDEMEREKMETHFDAGKGDASWVAESDGGRGRLASSDARRGGLDVKSTRCCSSSARKSSASEQQESSEQEDGGGIPGNSRKHTNTRAYFAALRKMDRVGGAITHDFGDPVGKISATMLGYAKQVFEMEALFGSLSAWHVAEIGVGFGGLCHAIFSRYAYPRALGRDPQEQAGDHASTQLRPPRSYTLVDLPEAEQLALKTLKRSLGGSDPSLTAEGRIRTYNSDALRSLKRTRAKYRARGGGIKSATLHLVHDNMLRKERAERKQRMVGEPLHVDHFFADDVMNAVYGPAPTSATDDEKTHPHRVASISDLPNPAGLLSAANAAIDRLGLFLNTNSTNYSNANATATTPSAGARGTTSSGRTGGSSSLGLLLPRPTALVPFAYDLCISNYAFNELVDEDIATEYLFEILAKCKRVFLTWGLAAADTGAAFGGLRASEWQIRILTAMRGYGQRTYETILRRIATGDDAEEKNEADPDARHLQTMHKSLVPFCIGVHDVPVLGGSIWAEATNRDFVYVNEVVATLESGTPVYNWVDPWDWETGFGRR